MHTTLAQFFERSIDDPESCRQLFNEVEFVSSKLRPLKYGRTEPLRQPYSVDAIAGDWGTAIFWKGGRPNSLGRFWPRNRFSPLDVVYYAVAGEKSADLLTSLLGRWSRRFPTYFGNVHFVADGHSRLPDYRRHIMPFGQGLPWREIEDRLPSVAWLMLFGAEYVRNIGRLKLLGAPAFRVSEASAGICVQLTESSRVIADDYPAYAAARDALIRYLGPEVVAPVDQDSLDS